MDTAVITLLGTLSGIAITQLANYVMESKKAKDRIEEKALDIEKNRKLSMITERRKAYASYFAELDIYVTNNRQKYDQFLVTYYNAMLLASPTVVQKIVDTFNLLKPEKFDTNAFVKAKESLLIEIHKELSDGV